MSTVSWPALVLAAGLGTRLGPIGQLRAKAAVPVAGRPIIVRILERLRQAGIRDVVINLHHRADTVCRVVGDGTPWDMRVRYSWERQALGSAGGPARALPLLAADRFFIVNGDTMTDIDLAELATAHVSSAALATLAVAPADLSHYNALLADAGQALLGSVVRGTDVATLPVGARPWHFVGVQAVDARAFAGVAPDRPFDIIREMYPALVASRPGAVRVHPVTGTFVDVGTPADYLATALQLTASGDGVDDRGADLVIAPDARVTSSILWDRVTIGSGANISHCIVTDDVKVPEGARYHRQVVTPDGVTPL